MVSGGGLGSVLAVVLCWGSLACSPKREYSIWLVPTGAQYDSLHSVVCELATRYLSPCYVPHVTVVGDVEGTLDDITRRAKQLAQRTRALDARLTSIVWKRGDYYRSFYAVVDETAGFSRLYEDTCTIIGKCQIRPYHMSLMYTSILSDSAKVAIRDSLYARRGVHSFGSTVRLTRMLVCFTSRLPPEAWTCPKELTLE